MYQIDMTQTSAGYLCNYEVHWQETYEDHWYLALVLYLCCMQL